jgi:hypothetical protein
MTVAHHYQPMLREALQARGWSIKCVECPKIGCTEAWQLTSTWSPVGAQVFLLFEEDDHLCWIAAANEEVYEHIDTMHLNRLYLKRGIERNLPQFLAAVDALRTSDATSIL